MADVKVPTTPPAARDAGPQGEAATYEDVLSIVETSCTFNGTCHGGPGRGNGNLRYLDTDLTTVMNGIPSCAYDRMPRVDPGHPENSWLMIKLEGARDASGRLTFEADPSWTPDRSDSACGSGDFGFIMPHPDGRLAPLSASQVGQFRSWILNGAQGPS